MSVFRSEIASQPNVLHALGATFASQAEQVRPLCESLHTSDLRYILFTGMGSSHAATHPSVLRLIEGGLLARSVEASELLHYQNGLITARTLLIIVSQSGRSAEVAPLLALARSRGAAVLGITNTPGSVLDEGSTVTCFIHAGEEATVSTKTYTCTLALLHGLTSLLLDTSQADAQAEVAGVAQAMREHMPAWQASITALAEEWAGVRFIEFLGRGYSMTSATTAALIAKESIKIPTEGLNSGQFRHGPIELVDADFRAVLFTGPAHTHDMNIALAHDILGYGGQVVLVGTQATDLPVRHISLPPVPPALLPLVEIVPVQWLCAELSARRGFIPGAFRYIGKVTVQE